MPKPSEEDIKEQATGWMRKGDYYSLVDLGCGPDAGRVIDLAKRHPDKHFLGIDHQLGDTPMEKAKVLPNLHLIRAPVHLVLPHLPNDSILAANADYFFNNISGDEAVRVLELLKTSLRKNGRLYVTHRLESPYERNFIKAQGFKVSGSKPVGEMRLPLTPYMKRDLEAIKGLEDLGRGEPAILPHELVHSGRFIKYMKQPKKFSPMRFSARLPRKK